MKTTAAQKPSSTNVPAGPQTRFRRSVAQDEGRESTPGLSLVVPAFNEEENLPALYARIVDALGNMLDWELILVDDGSRDLTATVMRDLQRKDSRVRAYSLAEHRGQTTATATGLRHARAPLIATLDADLQNDPVDLMALLEALGDNDAVVGYRMKRQDGWVRAASARVANAIRNFLSGDHIRDTGCSLKLFRAEAIRDIPMFEGMHRFFPTLLRFHGYRVIEHPVSHRPRVAGESKYGIRNRAWVGLKDLIVLRWMRSRIIQAPVPAERDRGGSEPDD